jgi:hypothetical protein
MTELSILQDWLPTKLSQRIALWTWPVATAGAALVRFLIPLTPSVTAAEIVLLQSTVFLFLVLAGSLITLWLVMRAYNALKNKQNQTISGGIWAGPEMESSKTPWNV